MPLYLLVTYDVREILDIMHLFIFRLLFPYLRGHLICMPSVLFQHI